MDTFMRIDQDLLYKVKVEAARQKRTMKDWVAEVLNRELLRQEKARKEKTV